MEAGKQARRGGKKSQAGKQLHEDAEATGVVSICQACVSTTIIIIIIKTRHQLDSRSNSSPWWYWCFYLRSVGFSLISISLLLQLYRGFCGEKKWRYLLGVNWTGNCFILRVLVYFVNKHLAMMCRYPTVRVKDFRFINLNKRKIGWKGKVELRTRANKWRSHTHTHTLYIYICVCVCVCELKTI